MSTEAHDAPKRRIGVICCGVFEWHFRRAAEKSPNEVEIVVLPAGLHANPAELRARLQAEIEAFEARWPADGIVLGYGLCGRGLARIAARHAPLALVRAEDCTAIFFGSEQRYRQEFLRYPGTLYFSYGWIHARGRGGFQTPRNKSLYDPDYEALAARFGREAADFIVAFRSSWKRNYERAVYIRFADDADAEAQQARVRALAQAEGWLYEEIDGDECLFQDLVDGCWDHPSILVVRPGEGIVPAAGAEVMSAGRSLEASHRQALARFRQRPPATPRPRQGLGLGIDAGGTYTDSVIYSFDERRVLDAAKAPTTHENLIVGVEQSLSALDRDMLRRVSRAALSTTLATNAIVEGRGQPVGLLLMGIDPEDLDRFDFPHKRLIPGRLTIEGVEREPVDPEATAAAVCALVAEGARALAVSGYAAVIDPRHEREAAAIARQTAGLPVVCGHELARTLNLFNRGVTAALNARLLPLIRDLVRSVRQCLDRLGLRDAPLMVVCGDGTQMLDRYAETFPVEQILSGPAASVIGALELTKCPDLVVADMGGTTLDVAVVRGGEPRLDTDGARVGGFQTCVRAMRIHTVGLGGDSEVCLGEWPRLRVGPRRIVPLAVLAAQHPTALDQLRSLGPRGLSPSPGFEPTHFALRRPGDWGGDLTDAQAAVLRELEAGPLLLVDLAKRVGAPSPQLLPLAGLEVRGAVIRSGLTPTDLLHLEGRFTQFCSQASALAFSLAAHGLAARVEELAQALWMAIRKGIAREVLRALLAEDGSGAPDEHAARFLVDSVFDADSDGRPEVRLRMRQPLAPIGAPVRAFFPDLARPLGAELVFTDHVEVANAVGAIAGEVALMEQVEIAAVSDGALQLQSRLETRKFFRLADALDHAERLIRDALREKAELNGIPFADPEFHARESAPQTRDGVVFLGVTLTGRVRA